MAEQTVQSVQAPGLELLRKVRAVMGTPLDPFDVRRKVFLLCGHPGCGKSSFALSVPRCCVLDTEGGACEIAAQYGIKRDDPRFPLRVVTDDQLQQVLTFLEADAANGERRMYDFVAVDTLDALGGNAFSVMGRYVAEKARGADYVTAIGEGQGWLRLQERLFTSLARIEAAGYGMMFFTHLTRKRVEQMDGSTRSELTRSLMKTVDEQTRNRAQYVGEMCKRLEDVPIMRTVELPNGTKTTSEVGSEKKVRHFVRFRSRDQHKEEWMKARLWNGDEFEFGPTDGFERFMVGYNSAVEEVKKRIAAQTEE